MKEATRRNVLRMIVVLFWFNSVAHLLANLTLRNALSLHWRWNHPLALQQLLQIDKNGIILRDPPAKNENFFSLS